MNGEGETTAAPRARLRHLMEDLADTFDRWVVPAAASLEEWDSRDRPAMPATWTAAVMALYAPLPLDLVRLMLDRGADPSGVSRNLAHVAAEALTACVDVDLVRRDGQDVQMARAAVFGAVREQLAGMDQPEFEEAMDTLTIALEGIAHMCRVLEGVQAGKTSALTEIEAVESPFESPEEAARRIWLDAMLMVAATATQALAAWEAWWSRSR